MVDRIDTINLPNDFVLAFYDNENPRRVTITNKKLAEAISKTEGIENGIITRVYEFPVVLLNKSENEISIVNSAILELQRVSVPKIKLLSRSEYVNDFGNLLSQITIIFK